jgi:hypothetical protein
MKILSLARAEVLLAVSFALAAPSIRADHLFFGNDDQKPRINVTDTAGNLLYQIDTTSTGDPPNGAITGIAFDGANLYFSTPFSHVIQRRTADGKTVLDSFPAPTANGASITEDLAWDPARQRLWRLSYSPPDMERINLATKMVDLALSLPTTDPVLGAIGAIGIAYDSRRDQLDVSFIPLAHPPAAAVVDAFNPDTGAYLGTLFRTQSEYYAGLAYDPFTDTLWAGGANADPSVSWVSHFARDGTLLSRFNSPDNLFGDGMELETPLTAIPEPASFTLLGIASLGLLGHARRRRKQAA